MIISLSHLYGSVSEGQNLSGSVGVDEVSFVVFVVLVVFAVVVVFVVVATVVFVVFCTVSAELCCDMQKSNTMIIASLFIVFSLNCRNFDIVWSLCT